MTRTVDFFYGLGSRYSYLAATQMAALEAETGCRVRWRPLSSVDLMARRGQSPFAGPPVSGQPVSGQPVSGQPVSGQYDWAYRQYDAECWAGYYGVPYREPQALVLDPRVLAGACLAAGRSGALVPFSLRLFRAIFAEHRRVERETLATLAAELGLEPALVAEPLADEGIAAELGATVEEAFARGAFGVPTFFVGERLFWGNDRLVLVRHALAKTAGSG